MGLLVCCFDFFFFQLIKKKSKESKETQLLAGPNKRVTKVYSSSKASLFQRRPEPIQSMRLRPTSQEGIFLGIQGRKRHDMSSVEKENLLIQKMPSYALSDLDEKPMG